MSCETARILIENDDPGLDEHMRSCPSCIIGAKAPYYTAPAGLDAKIRQALKRETASASPWRLWAIAASLLLVASIAGNIALFRSRIDPRDVIAADVFSAHVRSLAGDHLLDVASSDRHTVKPWFNGKLDFSPPVKFLDGFPLLGGRLEYFDGRPVAALVYGRNKHVINVFVRPEAASAGESEETRNGFHMETWTDGGMEFRAVSDLNEAELRQFVSAWRHG